MSPLDADSVRARLFVALQYLLPQHFISRLAYRITRSRVPLVKNALIRSFVRSFHPDMSEAEQPDPLQYESFNAFFTRALRAQARPPDPDPAALVSPVDGTVSQIGRLDGSWLVQAKGHAYTLESLLAADLSWATHLRGGAFATLYLAPFNYHRVHMPLRGALRAAWYVPGQLFSVNAITARYVPKLFARNERVLILFDTAFGQMALVMVGALNVGSIATVWAGDITPAARRQVTELPAPPLCLDKGEELGRFNMGSTVILLFQRGRARLNPDLRAGTIVRLGQSLGHIQ